MKIQVRWQVDDGYVGHRPQTTTIDTSDFETPITLSEVAEQLYEMLQDEFDNNISWYAPDIEVDAKKIFNVLQSNEKDDDPF